ncbi:family 43 glycosylhydrolase [Carboxylicivirga caseinilyticus]|uniref:family 43 glycosylhydrolase n=1 Tax=Carboxylicivirga caseinilyticus TaxID=3417572 RepID=UPI003D331B23|nr:family 43 glycosylhydrolase [Marinilabiliaceae bacterium A049]
MKKLYLLFTFIVISFAVLAQGVFTNPLSPNSQADPYVTYYEGFYYYTYTTGDHVEIRKSATLEGITAAQPVTAWRSWEEPAMNGPCWAPELHHINGKWYIYTTGIVPGTDQMRVIVLEGDNPQGTFTYKANLAGGIDATILKHPDGGLYMIWMRHEGTSLTNISIAPMNSPTSLASEWTQISWPNIDDWYDWEKRDQNCNEGPQIIQRNGKIFLIYSASASWTQWYCLGMFTCSDGNVMNASSWVKSPEPVFQKSDANGVYGVGHASLTISPDGKEDWICYHGMSAPNAGWEGREPRIQRFTWNYDGTPNFGIPVGNGVPIAVPANGRFVKLESARNPGYFVRHMSSRGRIDAEISILPDCQFKIVQGLADENAVSIEAANFPGHYLRHRNGEVWMDANDNSTLFKNDASWYLRTGLSDDEGISFESFNFPGRYIIQRNSLLYNEDPNTNLSDATFFDITTSVNGGLNIGNDLFIEAENYSLSNGAVKETCSEGGLNITLNSYKYTRYEVFIPKSGEYQVEVRVVSDQNDRVLKMMNESGSQLYNDFTINSTGGLQNWNSVTANVNLQEGLQTFTFITSTGGFNINWIKLTENPISTGVNESELPNTDDLIKIYPNPTDNFVMVETGNPLNITIYDINGQAVKQVHINESQKIDLSYLSQGIYFIVAEDQTKRSTHKLIIN